MWVHYPRKRIHGSTGLTANHMLNPYMKPQNATTTPAQTPQQEKRVLKPTYMKLLRHEDPRSKVIVYLSFVGTPPSQDRVKEPNGAIQSTLCSRKSGIQLPH
ncbi:hypothetical protein M8C21_008913, partial [Ambrosia artemisiifolia]